MKLETAKGVRDFPPEEKILRDEIVRKLVEVFEIYGYSPLETPAIERYDILAAKFAAGETSEAMKETFKFTDQGERELGLRFDLTVSLSRFIGMNPNMRLPFKRYEIGRVYRDGPIKLGRYREFWQCDVDVIGCKDMKADAELILLSIDVFKRLKFNAYLEVNNRKLLSGILDAVGIKKELMIPAIISIDKINKIGLAGVEKELFDLGIPKAKTKELTDIFDMRGTTKQILEKLKSIAKSQEGLEGIKELEELFEILGDLKDVKLNISLARGLTYYTGTVFEGFLRDSRIKSSICGGGRYDKMIGLYLGEKRDYPAVGISFGLEPITEALKLEKDFAEKVKKTVAKVFVIPIKTFKESMKITQKLRESGVKADIDLMEKGISKNLDFANSLSIPYVIFIGEEEIKQNKIKLRNMKTGKEELLNVENVIEKLINS